MLDFASTFPDARKNGSGWIARCPAHEDRKASLSIGTGDDGRVLLHCHAGCGLKEILGAAHLEHADLFPDTKPSMVATYPYHDEGGRPLFDVVRFQPKDFRQRRADGVWKMDGVRRVLYHLDQLQGQTIAYVVEGEKDADRLRAIGLPGTTNAGGAGKWRPEYVDQLKAATVESVAILPDNDETGRRHALQVATACHQAGLKVKVVMLPDLPVKGDVSDWLDAGHTKAELVALVKATALWMPTTETTARVTKKPATTGKGEKPKQGREVQLEDPDPWPEAVNGAALLDGLAATFSQYLALPAHASSALALWALHTYTFDACFASPFLAITSPVKRCGKTLTLILLGALVPRRLFASNVTPAVLFRTIEKYAPTLLIDEADTFVRDNDELRGVLNSGHTRTTAVAIRAVGDDHDPRAFSTWCPKAIALIGKLPGTLDDRAIAIAMRRRTAGERVERLRLDRIDADCQDLRRHAARWAADCLDGLRQADPTVPVGLHDRAADCWRPLLALADAAGGRWPDLAREAAIALSGESAEDDATTVLLQDIQSLFETDGNPDVFAATKLAEGLNSLEDRPWCEWSHGRPLSAAKLTRMLAAYGIQSAGNVRHGDKVLKSYRRIAFEDAWTRYLPTKPLHRYNANESGPEVPKTNRYMDAACSGLEMAVSPITTGLCSGVAVSQGEEGKNAQFAERVPFDPTTLDPSDCPVCGRDSCEDEAHLPVHGDADAGRF